MEFIQIKDQLVSTLVLCDIFFKTTVCQFFFFCFVLLKRGKRKKLKCSYAGQFWLLLLLFFFQG